MPVDLDALRAAGSRTIALRTSHGRFVGHVTQTEIPDSAIVVMFAVEGQSDEPLVVPVDSIEEIEER